MSVRSFMVRDESDEWLIWVTLHPHRAVCTPEITRHRTRRKRPVCHVARASVGTRGTWDNEGTCCQWHVSFGTRGTWHRTIQAHLAHGTGHYWHQWNGHPYKTLGTSNSRRRRRLNSTTVTPNTGTGCNELSHREALFFIFYLLHRCSLEIVNLLRKVFRNGWNSKRLKSWYLNSLCFTKESYETK